MRRTVRETLRPIIAESTVETEFLTVESGQVAGIDQTAILEADGVEIMTIGYNRTYAPNTHFIELGIAERGESVIDAVYRNFSVVRRGN